MQNDDQMEADDNGLNVVPPVHSGADISVLWCSDTSLVEDHASGSLIYNEGVPTASAVRIANSIAAKAA